MEFAAASGNRPPTGRHMMVHSLIALHSDLVQAASTTACTLRSLNPVFQKWVFRPSRVRQPQWLAIAFALLSFALFARSPVVRSSARYHSLSRFSVASRNCQGFRIDRPRRSTGAFARLSYRRCLTGDLSLGWPWRSCPPFLLAYATPLPAYFQRMTGRPAIALSARLATFGLVVR